MHLSLNVVNYCVCNDIINSITACYAVQRLQEYKEWIANDRDHILYCGLFKFLYLHYLFLLTHVMHSPTFFRVASLALGQSYDCFTASEQLQDLKDIH